MGRRNSGKRTDADIARSVDNLLQWTASLPKDGVTAMVEGGWVTLTGEVDWEFQRLVAARGVGSLRGVTGVSDEIAIRPKFSSGAVKAEIEAALKRRAKVEAQNIRVEVHGADVTLTGSVHSWAERELATHSAWGTPGVRHVVDNITVAC